MLDLTNLEGKISFNVDMTKLVWFRTGGKAQILFEPINIADLISFLKAIPESMKVYPIGFGSNILVRDGGYDGALLRLGAKDFGKIKFLGDNSLYVECGASDKQISLAAAQYGIGGLHFYAGIPGNLGGAIAMNAGANNIETSDCVVSVKAIDKKGNIVVLNKEELDFGYRHCGKAKKYIFLSAILKGYSSNKETVLENIKTVMQHREEVQPIREKTSGSTFKNLPNKRAWQAIDEAGCRGLQIGGAQISKKHCNFIINVDNATAYDLEKLGETVRQKVFDKTGDVLIWEIEIIGNYACRKIIPLEKFK